ncbi:MAG: M42 family peptidase [Anaerolineae bacterium]|nr:M42 family peptidase [Anaerolineae bacterium]
MTEQNWDLLEKICAIHAVSGREDAMTAFVRDHIHPLVDEVSVDNLGNVVAIIKGSKHPDHRLMLQAHIDELGLIIRNISDDGFLLIERVGGVPEKSLLGQRVDILTDKGDLIPGYVGTKSHHITSSDEKFVVPKVHDMFIDVGLSSRNEIHLAGIQVGDPVTYAPNFHHFGDGMICSKALDNRASVFILLEALKSFSKERPPCTIVFSFTVLEEFSIRGSLPTVTAAKPDAIISLDITIATDTPTDPPLHPVTMRQGPAIKMMDFHGRGTLGGMFSSPKLRRFIEAEAKKNDIPLQREVIVGVITDPAFQLYLGEKGYIIAGISIPTRYSHAAIQMCHESDIADTLKLVKNLGRSFSPNLDLSRG